MVPEACVIEAGATLTICALAAAFRAPAPASSMARNNIATLPMPENSMPSDER